MGNTKSAAGEGEALYTEAHQDDQAGKTKKAIKQYEKMANEFPFAPSAGEARYRQAVLLDQIGETEDAFEAYDKYLQSFPGTPNYGSALDRMSAIATSAADGKIQSSMLGMKSNISLEKTVVMLGKVRDRAPKSALAAKSQFTMAEAYQNHKKFKEAVTEFRKLVSDQPSSSLAPEALFKVGQILLEDAQRGNQNQATLDLSREAFNDYLIQYPGHSRNAEAREMIQTLNGRELQRSFDVAEFYVKTGKIESAKVYYRDILKNSQSGKLHDAAQARLKELGN
jgi:outer membrane protein assembly factor BamD (BamD/ComL family)